MEETAQAEANPPDPRAVAMYSIHLPKNATGYAARLLQFPSGVKKRMNKDQTDKDAEDYPHFQSRLTAAQAADLESKGYELRLLQKSVEDEPASDNPQGTQRDRARAAKKKG